MMAIYIEGAKDVYAFASELYIIKLITNNGFTVIVFCLNGQKHIEEKVVNNHLETSMAIKLSHIKKTSFLCLPFVGIYC